MILVLVSITAHKQDYIWVTFISHLLRLILATVLVLAFSEWYTRRMFLRQALLLGDRFHTL